MEDVKSSGLVYKTKGCMVGRVGIRLVSRKILGIPGDYPQSSLFPFHHWSQKDFENAS